MSKKREKKLALEYQTCCYCCVREKELSRSRRHDVSHLWHYKVAIYERSNWNSNNEWFKQFIINDCWKKKHGRKDGNVMTSSIGSPWYVSPFAYYRCTPQNRNSTDVTHLHQSFSSFPQFIGQSNKKGFCGKWNKWRKTWIRPTCYKYLILLLLPQGAIHTHLFSLQTPFSSRLYRLTQEFLLLMVIRKDPYLCILTAADAFPLFGLPLYKLQVPRALTSASSLFFTVFTSPIYFLFSVFFSASWFKRGYYLNFISSF